MSQHWPWIWRWIHLIAGVAWIGHLWFFNFVNLNVQKDLSADVKKVVNPPLLLRALFFFRWGAMITYISGWFLIFVHDYMARWGQLFQPGNADTAAWGILLGMLFGTVMWFNVWFIIWPAQQKVIGAMQGGPAPDPSVGPRALLASKINTYLSVPLFLGMIASHNTPVFGGGAMGMGLGTLAGFALVWLTYKYAPAVSTKLVQAPPQA